MKKRVILYGFMILLLISGCQKKKPSPGLKEISEDDVLLEQQVEYSNFEASLKDSTDVIVATYVQEQEYDTYTEQEFWVKQVLKGATETSTIYVFERPAAVHIEDCDISYISGRYPYETGKDYLLILEREVSVYYDHDRYVLSGEIYMPMSDREASMIYDTRADEHMEADIAELEAEADLIHYVETTLAAEPTQTKEFFGTPYVESEELCDIVPASTHILQIKIDRLLLEGFERETYVCEIQKSFKGDISSFELEDGIFIPFFKNQVKRGEEYVVLLDKGEEDSLVYTFSSRNSIFPTEDKEAIATIEEILDRENKVVNSK